MSEGSDDKLFFENKVLNSMDIHLIRGGDASHSDAFKTLAKLSCVVNSFITKEYNRLIVKEISYGNSLPLAEQRILLNTINNGIEQLLASRKTVCRLEAKIIEDGNDRGQFVIRNKGSRGPNRKAPLRSEYGNNLEFIDHDAEFISERGR